MRKTQAALALLLSCALLAGSLGPALAAPYKPKTFSVNPATLRVRLFSSNFRVLGALSDVRKAKANVEIARGNLLPRLNIGATIATSGPTFALAAISFLFPFLLPSNWANLYQSKYLLEAEKVGYRLVLLNQYASAYTLYATVMADLQLREVLVTKYNDLSTIRDWLINQRRFVGSVPQEDIDNADAQAKMAFADIANMDKMLVAEKGALMEMLALDPRDTLNLEPVTVAPSAAEEMDLSAAIAKAQAVAPEMTQMVHLDRAAREGKFSKAFGFMSGQSLNVYQDGKGIAFKDLKASAPFSIGFDYVPSIQLASEDIRAIRLRREELRLHIAHLVDMSRKSVDEAGKALGALSDAEQKLKRVYQAEFRKYTLGQADLLHVFDAGRAVATATAAKVKARLDLDLLRIGLHREFLTDQFGSVPGCRIRPEAVEKNRSWLRKLFRSKDFTISIDEACRPG